MLSIDYQNYQNQKIKVINLSIRLAIQLIEQDKQKLSTVNQLNCSVTRFVAANDWAWHRTIKSFIFSSTYRFLWAGWQLHFLIEAFFVYLVNQEFWTRGSRNPGHIEPLLWQNFDNRNILLFWFPAAWLMVISSLLCCSERRQRERGEQKWWKL